MLIGHPNPYKPCVIPYEPWSVKLGRPMLAVFDIVKGVGDMLITLFIVLNYVIPKLHLVYFSLQCLMVAVNNNSEYLQTYRPNTE